MGGVVDFVDNIIGTDLSGKKASQNALDAQVGAADQSARVQKEMYNQTRADLQPFRQVGEATLSQLASPDFQRDFTMSDFQKDPGYAFRMAEGQKAIERSAAARGGLNSGATLKSLARYSQGLASEEFNNAYNRFNSDRDRRFNRLSSLANMGQSSAAGQASAATNLGASLSDLYTGMGNARAASEMAKLNQQNWLLEQGAKGGAYVFSDERLKAEIEPISSEDLAELKRAIKPYKFKYLSHEHGKGDWIGVMAQDLEKTKLGRSLVSEDENGIKVINIKKALSLLLATCAEEVA